jgi:hypothetical protein
MLRSVLLLCCALGREAVPACLAIQHWQMMVVTRFVASGFLDPAGKEGSPNGNTHDQT